MLFTKRGPNMSNLLSNNDITCAVILQFVHMSMFFSPKNCTALATAHIHESEIILASYKKYPPLFIIIATFCKVKVLPNFRKARGMRLEIAPL